MPRKITDHCPTCGHVREPIVALTDLQRDMLLVIQEYFDEAGAAPSFDELRAELGLKSKSQISQVFSHLERRGYIHRQHGRARAITILRRIPTPQGQIDLEDAIARERAAA